MSQTRHWPLSRKSNGVCSVCRATRQLHLKDGTVHKHGPRDNLCPGSHKPPVGVVSQQSSPSAPDASATVASSVANNDLSGSSAQTVLDPVREWAPSGLPVIKHIPKSARPACASHFAAVLRAIVAKPTDNTNWLSLFNWGVSVLQPPKRGGKRHNLTSNIKRRISEFSPGAVLTPNNEFSA